MFVFMCYFVSDTHTELEHRKPFVRSFLSYKLGRFVHFHGIAPAQNNQSIRTMVHHHELFHMNICMLDMRYFKQKYRETWEIPLAFSLIQRYHHTHTHTYRTYWWWKETSHPLSFTEHVHSLSCICCALASFGTPYRIWCVPDKEKTKNHRKMFLFLDDFYILDRKSVQFKVDLNS